MPSHSGGVLAPGVRRNSGANCTPSPRSAVSSPRPTPPPSGRSGGAVRAAGLLPPAAQATPSPPRGERLSVGSYEIGVGELTPAQTAALEGVARECNAQADELVRVGDVCQRLRSDLEGKNALLAEKDALIAQLRGGESAELQAFRERQSRALAELEQRLAEARQELAAREGELADSSAQLARAELTALSLRQELAVATQANRGDGGAGAQEATQRAERLEQELADTERQCGVVTEELHSLRAAHAAGQQELKELRMQLAAAGTAEQRASSDLTSFRQTTIAEMTRQGKALEEASARAREAVQQLQRVRAESLAHQARVRELQLTTEEKELENARLRAEVQRLREELAASRRAEGTLSIELRRVQVLLGDAERQAAADRAARGRDGGTAAADNVRRRHLRGLVGRLGESAADLAAACREAEQGGGGAPGAGLERLAAADGPGAAGADEESRLEAAVAEHEEVSRRAAGLLRTGAQPAADAPAQDLARRLRAANDDADSALRQLRGCLAASPPSHPHHASPRSGDAAELSAEVARAEALPPRLRGLVPAAEAARESAGALQEQAGTLEERCRDAELRGEEARGHLERAEQLAERCADAERQREALQRRCEEAEQRSVALEHRSSHDGQLREDLQRRCEDAEQRAAELERRLEEQQRILHEAQEEVGAAAARHSDLEEQCEELQGRRRELQEQCGELEAARGGDLQCGELEAARGGDQDAVGRLRSRLGDLERALAEARQDGAAARAAAAASWQGCAELLESGHGRERALVAELQDARRELLGAVAAAAQDRLRARAEPPPSAGLRPAHPPPHRPLAQEDPRRSRRQCAYMGLEVSDGAHLAGTRPGHPQLRVHQIVDDGPAHAGGIRVGDRILQLAGHPVHELDDFRAVACRIPPGDPVQFTVGREGHPRPLVFIVETEVTDEDNFVPGVRRTERVVMPADESLSPLGASPAARGASPAARGASPAARRGTTLGADGRHASPDVHSGRGRDGGYYSVLSPMLQRSPSPPTPSPAAAAAAAAAAYHTDAAPAAAAVPGAHRRPSPNPKRRSATSADDLRKATAMGVRDAKDVLASARSARVSGGPGSAPRRHPL
eukprot:TRINITY_DN42547_c0_g1_i4.p1 TRINITY_DN42547_c0_g1~~TRINITY_DN42547_c0_g1_i4.p1  ORF type:complete len:1114 (+),score=322.39 TRINITY_DN42547_c0_g1_i4:67-3342(+)